MTATLQLNGELVRDTFRTWAAEQQSLDAQLTESLAALTAYQSHLDAWQQQLVQQREELSAQRQQIDQDRSAAENSRTHALAETSRELDAARDKIAAAEKSHTHALAESSRELDAARDKIAAAEKGHAHALAESARELDAARDKIDALTTMLLSRTEELRTLDNRRAEVVTELELARAREKELTTAMEEQKRTGERERAQSAEEVRHLREILERQLEASAYEHADEPHTGEVKVQQQAAGTRGQVEARENPVLGSIVEQFGKLRQQRASDRQASKKSR